MDAGIASLPLPSSGIKLLAQWQVYLKQMYIVEKFSKGIPFYLLVLDALLFL